MPRDLRSSALSTLMGGQKPAARSAKTDERPEAEERASGTAPSPTLDKTAAKRELASRRTAPEDEPEALREPTEPDAQPGEKAQGNTRAEERGRPRKTAPVAAPVVEPAADGYVGRSQYQRKRRGLVTKVAVHLSPDVAAALRVAGAVGDENGLNMSEIVETLLVQAGYGA